MYTFVECTVYTVDFVDFLQLTVSEEFSTVMAASRTYQPPRGLLESRYKPASTL